MFCVARCLLLFASLVVSCDDGACRLFGVGVVHPSCLWCVGVLAVCRRCWLLLWLMGGVCVPCCCSLLYGVCCLWSAVCRCSLLLSSLLVCVLLVSFVVGVRCLSRNGVAWCSLFCALLFVVCS